MEEAREEVWWFSILFAIVIVVVCSELVEFFCASSSTFQRKTNYIKTSSCAEFHSGGTLCIFATWEITTDNGHNRHMLSLSNMASETDKRCYFAYGASATEATFHFRFVWIFWVMDHLMVLVRNLRLIYYAWMGFAKKRFISVGGQNFVNNSLEELEHMTFWKTLKYAYILYNMVLSHKIGIRQLTPTPFKTHGNAKIPHKPYHRSNSFLSIRNEHQFTTFDIL